MKPSRCNKVLNKQAMTLHGGWAGAPSYCGQEVMVRDYRKGEKWAYIEKYRPSPDHGAKCRWAQTWCGGDTFAGYILQADKSQQSPAIKGRRNRQYNSQKRTKPLWKLLQPHRTLAAVLLLRLTQKELDRNVGGGRREI